MKPIFFFFLLVFTWSLSAQTTKKVLFLGNSYTAVNNLPQMVQNMANSTDDILIYDSNTPGGYRFMDHASSSTSLDKINADTWDYVVLQAQSQETSLSQAQMEAEVFPYATSLSNSIRANNECSQPLFYMTWGRENGDASNCAWLPWVCTYEGMDDVIQATYIFMADSNDAELAPAGKVWRYLRENYPDLDLYAGDGSHPSLLGSYAVACAFYTMIYKKDPTLITWNSSLEENKANLIKNAAKTIVFDDIASWDFAEAFIADFTELINGAEVSFTNTGSDFETVLWDFGDFSTSTEINPVHIYAESGSYIVKLTTTKCGKSDTKTKTLTINLLSRNNFREVSLSIFPNPAEATLEIEFSENYTNIQAVIFGISGKSLLNFSAKNNSILKLNISSLKPGIYMLKIKADDHYYVEKIIKR